MACRCHRTSASPIHAGNHGADGCVAASHVAPEFDAKLREVYSTVRGVSIDYGVMEPASAIGQKAKVYVLRAGALGWSDVGSWDEVYRLSEKDLENNVLIGSHVVARNSRGCLVISRNDQSSAHVWLDRCHRR